MSTADKSPYETVLPIARDLVARLAPHCRRIELAGSLRRHTPLVGDIEICAIPILTTNLFGEPVRGAPTAVDHSLTNLGVTFTLRGEKFQQFNWLGRNVDLFICTPETWGVNFTIRTGSADFSHWLVTSELYGGATPFGMVFREARLWFNGRRLVTPEEEDVFAALGQAWIPPEKRTGPLDTYTRVEPVRNVEPFTR